MKEKVGETDETAIFRIDEKEKREYRRHKVFRSWT